MLFQGLTNFVSDFISIFAYSSTNSSLFDGFLKFLRFFHAFTKFLFYFRIINILLLNTFTYLLHVFRIIIILPQVALNLRNHLRRMFLDSEPAAGLWSSGSRKC